MNWRKNEELRERFALFAPQKMAIDGWVYETASLQSAFTRAELRSLEKMRLVSKKAKWNKGKQCLMNVWECT